MTYAQARSRLLGGLRSCGWTVVDHLKVPHATSPNGRVRLWFKARSIHAGATPREARSLWIDPKLLADDPPERIGKLLYVAAWLDGADVHEIAPPGVTLIKEDRG